MRCKVFGVAGGHVGGEGVEAEDVEVVFEVVELDGTAKGIIFGAGYEVLVALAFTFGYGQDAVNYRLRKSLGEKKFRSDVGILDGIMQEGDHLFFICTAAQGNAHRVLKISASHLVALTCVLRHTY